MRTFLLSGLLSFGFLWVPLGASAQHPTSGFSGHGEETNCDACHGSHGNGPSYNLRLPGRKGVGQIGSPLGAITQSCLRCHLSDELREEEAQGLSASPSLLLEGGRYLSEDFSNDHPLGLLSLDEWGMGVGQRYRSNGAEVARPGFGVTEINCATCHDPHDRRGPIPDPQEELSICLQCHTDARFQSHGGVSQACSTCHSVHGGSSQQLLASGNAGGRGPCIKCHGDLGAMDDELGLKADAPLFYSPRPPQHPEATENCVACHSLHGGR